MVEIFKTDIKTNATTKINKISKGVLINMSNPTEDEIDYVCKNTKIKEDFIRYALDYEEKARIDKEDEDGTVLYIIDTPAIEKEHDSTIYSTMPMGVIIVRDDYIITVSIKANKIIKNIENKIQINTKELYTYKKSRILLQILYNNAELFLDILKKINKETEVAEHVLKTSMKNKEVLQMLNLEKSLVYLTTSLKSNELVMEKTMRGKVVKLYEEDQDLLEDTIIENRQAIEMSQIYSNILGSTMEAYASIISNNVNGVMKVLTSITVIIAIPTLVASFWGMNVPVPFQNNSLGFAMTIGISILLAIIATIWLKKKDMLN